MLSPCSRRGRNHSSRKPSGLSQDSFTNCSSAAISTISPCPQRSRNERKSQFCLFRRTLVIYPPTVPSDALFCPRRQLAQKSLYKEKASHRGLAFLPKQQSLAYAAMNSVRPWRFTRSSGSLPAFFRAFWNSETFFTAWWLT